MFGLEQHGLELKLEIFFGFFLGGQKFKRLNTKLEKIGVDDKTWKIRKISHTELPIIGLKIICPCITKQMLMKNYFILSRMFLECFNDFIVVHGHVHHIMEITKDCTSHFNIFDFFNCI